MGFDLLAQPSLRIYWLVRRLVALNLPLDFNSFA